MSKIQRFGTHAMASAVFALLACGGPVTAQRTVAPPIDPELINRAERVVDTEPAPQRPQASGFICGDRLQEPVLPDPAARGQRADRARIDGRSRRGRTSPPVGGLNDSVLESGCNEKRVNSPDELEATLRSDFVGCVIVPRYKSFNMSGRSSIPLRSGVSLIGERGELCSRPVLYTDTRTTEPGTGYALFEVAGNNVRVSGLHFRGPMHDDRSSAYEYATGIHVLQDPDQKLGRGIVIIDNELDQWIGSGVGVDSTHRVRVLEQYEAGWAAMTRADASLVQITRNYMHHNARDGGGYGVTVGGGAYATVEANVFDFNRHAVASNGFAHSGYLARFNYILQGGFMQDNYYNQHFDVHGTNDTDGDNKSTGYGGTAGEYYEIAFNTIRGAQSYHFVKTRSAFMLRGAPTLGAHFFGNVTVHEDLDAAVSLKMDGGDSGIGEHHDDFNFESSGNRFNTDYSDQLATGDFDGDGRTDVFIATGTAWFFSRAGSEPWEFLHASNKLVGELGFADIDNDKVTDVLYRDPAGNVGYLKSGRIDLVPLTTSPVSMKDTRFGDFDGDGLTDIFYTRDRQWQVWFGSTRAWTPTASSSLSIESFLFGEFDDVRGTDVAAVTSGMWAYSSGSRGSWTKLNGKLRSSFADAVAADFNGDGKTDIAFSDEVRQAWDYSPGGRLPVRALREADGLVPYPPLRKLLSGRFDGDSHVEVLSYYRPIGDFGGPLENHFVIWRGAIRADFAEHSREAMR